jgi:glyoxylase-like metal-dependent hydrolase (beta-lactamase superfamily II)
MFGVVPKPLWERKITPDGRNRIPLALRCLLVEAPEALVLVDTGVGSKEDAKFRDIYAVRNEGRPTRLEDSIRAAGFRPGKIDLVILTHLHFDHSGGNTCRKGERVVPTFPNATYIVAREDYATAIDRNERTADSYRRENWEPLEKTNQLRLVDGDQEIVPGVSLVHTPGHTPGHHSVKVESGGRTVFFLGDLCATLAHVPLPWIMGYDLFPLTTLATRKRIYQQAVAEKWLLLFDHDPDVFAGVMSVSGGRHLVAPALWEH